MIKISWILVILFAFCSYGLASNDPFASVSRFYTNSICSGSPDYTNFIRIPGCWPYGDGSYFYGAIGTNSNYSFSYECDSNCSNCELSDSVHLDQCYPTASNISKIGHTNQFSALGDTVIAYFTGDSSINCNTSYLTSMDAISIDFLYPDGYGGAYLLNCTNNIVNIYYCDNSDSFSSCTDLTETQPTGVCVNSDFAFGAAIYSCGSYAPYGDLSTSSSSAASSSTAFSTSTHGATATATTTASGNSATTTTTASATTTTTASGNSATSTTTASGNSATSTTTASGNGATTTSAHLGTTNGSTRLIIPFLFIVLSLVL